MSLRNVMSPIEYGPNKQDLVNALSLTEVRTGKPYEGEKFAPQPVRFAVTNFLNGRDIGFHNVWVIVKSLDRQNDEATEWLIEGYLAMSTGVYGDEMDRVNGKPAKVSALYSTHTRKGQISFLPAE